MCRTKNGNIIFDTGYLDSHKDLGINTPPEDRVLFRRVSTCAPLVTDGYRRSHNYSDGEEYVQYYYGQELLQSQLQHHDYASLTADEKRNLTIEWPNATLNGAHFDFDIKVIDSFVINGSMTNDYSGFQPIPALTLQEADLHLLFLSANSIRFSEPVSDPWYAAHRTVANVPVERGANISGTMDAILQDEPLVPLACTVAEQYCNPNQAGGARCPRLGGTYESEALARGIWSSGRQRAVYRWIAHVNTLISPTIDFVPKALGVGALTARYKAQGGVQGPLPDDQWQMETEYWHAASMVALQWWVVSIATGPSDAKIMPWLVTVNGTDEGGLCSNLKVFNSSYLNFSVIGLAAILIVGGVLIVISSVLEPIIAFVQRRCKLDAYSRLEWATNETLQLQRLAHEELGMGTWRRCARSVPVTYGDASLAMLDLRDIDHPRLKLPSSPVGQESSGSPDDGGRDDFDIDGKKPEERVQEMEIKPLELTTEQTSQAGDCDGEWKRDGSGSEMASPVSLMTEDSPVSTRFTHQSSMGTLVERGSETIPSTEE
ncbi:putative cytochrome p450 protein [Neofusicoccum parvum]|nr:putative cytochrome p450 protein [Neofusicoccum parvum]